MILERDHEHNDGYGVTSRTCWSVARAGRSTTPDFHLSSLTTSHRISVVYSHAWQSRVLSSVATAT